MTETTDTAIATVWLKWAWRHYSLTVEEYPTYDEAVAAASYMSDAGEESLSCIEGPDGRVDPDRVKRDMTARQDAAFKEYENAPKPTHGVRLKSPDGEHEAWFSTYYSETEAEAKVAHLRPQLGDRVTVQAFV